MITKIEPGIGSDRPWPDPPLREPLWSLDVTCLTPAEAQAVAKIWEGARSPGGDFLWYGLERGASFAGLANSSNTTPPQFRPFAITLDHWRLWLMQNPAFDWKKLDPDADISDPNSFERGFRLSQLKFHSVIGTDDPGLKSFRKHGGKMITYHGWNDQLIFPRGSIDYYARVVKANGGLHQVRKFDRLFMVAGMNHCAGGVGAVNFGKSGVTIRSTTPSWLCSAGSSRVLRPTSSSPRPIRRTPRRSRGRSAPIRRRSGM